MRKQALKSFGSNALRRQVSLPDGSQIFASSTAEVGSWTPSPSGLVTEGLANDFAGRQCGVRVEGQGVSWHRLLMPEIPLTAGVKYYAGFFFEYGSSENIFFQVYNNDGASGIVNLNWECPQSGGSDGAVGTEKGGQIVSAATSVFEGAIMRADICFEVDASFMERIGVGPRASELGQDVIVYHGQIGLGGFAPEPVWLS